MKLLIFGATGLTGSALVARALAAGHAVTAVARGPEAIDVRHPHLRVVRGDATHRDEVAAPIAGHDAVLSALGPRKGTPAGTLISDATRYIVEAMRRHNVRRLVLESGLMVGECRGMGAFGRGAVALFRKLNEALYCDKLAAEQLVMQAVDLDWVIVRPPMIKRVPARGRHRIGVDLDVGLTAMAAGDVAEALLACAQGREHVGKAVEISN